ncbi:MAG: EF-hand domain-containing protein [Sphingomonadales bacterium]
MGRFLAGVASALLLVTAGFFIWKAQADRGSAVPPAPVASLAGLADADSVPPTATEKTREEKRFSRYDRDKDGAVGREEYLLSRRKAFAKFDTNGDGRLSFDEYAIKTATKFAVADKDRNGALNPNEFSTTRVVRKSQPKCACRPATQAPPPAEEPEES